MEIKTSEEILYCKDDNFLRDKKWVALDDLISNLTSLALKKYNVDSDAFYLIKDLKQKGGLR